MNSLTFVLSDRVYLLDWKDLSRFALVDEDFGLDFAGDYGMDLNSLMI